jgi:hypothetical protein
MLPMKPATTLKEVLKPPFYHDAIGQIYDGNTRLMEVPGYSLNENNKTDSHLAKVR